MPFILLMLRFTISRFLLFITLHFDALYYFALFDAMPLPLSLPCL